MEEISLIIRRARRGGETKLNLSNKQLTEIPSEIFQLGFLKELDLSNNKLTSINPNINQLPLLKKLNLAYNSIDKIPKEIQKMELDELILTGNPCENDKPAPQENYGFGQMIKPGSQMKDMRRQMQVQESQQTTQQLLRKGQKFSASLESINQQTNQMKIQQIEQQIEIIQATLARRQYPKLDIELQEIEFLEQISKGDTNTIHKAFWRGTEVVVKKILDSAINQEVIADLENEITMMNYLRHPNTLLLIGASLQSPNLFIVSEHCHNKSLYEVLHKVKMNLQQERKMKILYDVALTLYFYHECGVVFRDLNSQNILLDANFIIRLCDFGQAKFINELNVGSLQFSLKPAYTSPEIFQKRAYDSSVDVFAYGTLM